MQERMEVGVLCIGRRDCHDNAARKIDVVWRPNFNTRWLTADPIRPSAEQCAIIKQGVNVAKVPRTKPRDDL
jgi:hypothetical protein